MNARIATNLRRGRGEFGLELALAAAREQPDDDFAVRGKATVTAAVVLMRPRDFDRNAELDAIAPRLVLGLQGGLAYQFSEREDYQETSFDDIQLLLHLDAQITDEIGLRLGVPVTGDLVTRAQDDTAVPPVTRSDDLQWRIPVFVSVITSIPD